MFAVPDHFVRTQDSLNGAEGLAWVTRLPQILTACARRWDLALDGPLEPLTYNYIVGARRADGTPVIVKACAPAGEFRVQAEALLIFDGRGAARLLEADRADEVMLLERCEPGTPLLALEDDEEATAIAASVMREVWRPAPPGHPFPTVGDWGRGFARLRTRFGGGSGPFPAPLVDEAERLFTDLETSMADPVLLHDDLHHDNILAADRAPWLAIDPKGLVGEPAYDVGALLRNRLPAPLVGPEARRALARRVDQLSENLGFDRARVRGWAVAQAVLSAWWTVEDHGHGWERAIACAELLASIRG